MHVNRENVVMVVCIEVNERNALGRLVKASGNRLQND